MRMIGELDNESQAQVLSDFLYVKGIDNQIEMEKEGTSAIWIHSEEELDNARRFLEEFREKPADFKYHNVAEAAARLREKKKREQVAYGKRVKERSQLFQPISAYGFGPLTLILIAISVCAYLVAALHGQRTLDILYISLADIRDAGEISIWRGFLERLSLVRQVLPEIHHGQVWRLITPIFVHFGFLHIFFNMLWLRDLGSMIEARVSSLFFLILVLALAMVSNLAQYFIVGAGFGGMSGVVYGLFGYVWIRGKFDPVSGLYVSTSTVVMMIIWFFVCLVGIMGPVANACHAAGLLMGVSWGYLSSLRRR